MIAKVNSAVKNLVITQVKSILAKMHLSLVREAPNSKLLSNVFNATHEKRALVSYITSPFISGLESAHTNTLECFTACQILDKIGYIVDVIDYDIELPLGDYESYSVVYGFGVSLEKSCLLDINNNIKKIIYGTGCDTLYSNTASLRRAKEFFYKSNLVCMSSTRIADLTWRRQIVMSDLIICLGNEFVKNTFKSQTDTKVEQLDLFFREVGSIDLAEKNYSIAKYKFLWWGSTGAVHKGLDLILEAFSKREDVEIYICGYHPESPFDEYFNKKINQSSNIHNLGFVGIGTSLYYKLMEECSSVIFPSVSEGGAAGIIQLACTAGIIPIIPASVGIDIVFPELQIKEFDRESIDKCIDTFIQFDSNEIETMSIDLRTKLRSKHSYEQYCYRLETLIMEGLSSST